MMSAAMFAARRAMLVVLAALLLMSGLASRSTQPLESTPPAATAATPGAEPLAHHEVTAANLPAPFATRGADNPPRVIARPEGVQLNLPPGFEIRDHATGGFEEPRWMALAGFFDAA